MVFFNDPIPCDDPALRAVRMAVAMRSRVQDLIAEWTRRGHDLGFSIGIAQGFATLGGIGFEGRYDYAAIGSVATLRHGCAQKAQDQILVTQRVHAATVEHVIGQAVGEMTLRGFTRPVQVYDVKGLDAARVTS